MGKFYAIHTVASVHGRYVLRTRNGARWTEGVTGIRTLRSWVAQLREMGYSRTDRIVIDYAQRRVV